MNPQVMSRHSIVEHDPSSPSTALIVEPVHPDQFYDLWLAAIVTDALPVHSLGPKELGLLAAGSRRTHCRDVVTSHLSGDRYMGINYAPITDWPELQGADRGAAIDRLIALVTRIEDLFAVELLAILAAAAIRENRAELARDALDRALNITPDHRFSRILEKCLAIRAVLGP